MSSGLAEITEFALTLANLSVELIRIGEKLVRMFPGRRLQ
ncbi:putative Kef-type K+ transport protein [Mesorhizobium sp. RMAD-H1]|nr:putative Kef-type K+ transport protein [Mesorhizobium sp. RMAD-H1]